VAVVELKLFKDFRQKTLIERDYKKLREFMGICPINAYMGVFVTETTSKKTEERVEELEAALERKFDIKGPVYPSADNIWGWQFVSAKLPCFGDGA
jgi:hypothetical protein